MLVGKEIGPYVVDKELGAGAMGAVYRATHAETGNKVAIKIIAPGLAARDAAMTRFKREISILKQLDHPNIVKLLASGKFKGTPFYVMEYVSGESLDHVMERRGRITWDELVPLGQQLCAALQYAHDKGIIHRDLKPSNLMVLRDGIVKLTDFGIAKDTDVTALTAANSTVGTASYMSPEQCKGTRDLTPKSDLYSMGVMFFELLTGRKPFYAESIMEMFNQHLTGTFERPSRLILEIPIWLDTLVCQLLEKDPDKRPFNAAMVSESLGMVKDKVASQLSAGIDAAKKRRIDRSPVDTALDETDKDIARTLLGKKKKKAKAVPFYRKGWFTLPAVGAVLAGFGFAFYLVFLKVPSPESYLERARTQLQSANFQERKEGREAVDEFLRHYPDHAQAGDMQKLADAYDRDETEKQMHNRRNRFKAEGTAESVARDALDNEDLGKLGDAALLWEQLAAYAGKKDREDRAWGLVAKKYLEELRLVEKNFEDVQKKVYEETAAGKKHVPESREERLAMEAVRKEQQQPSQASIAWNDLKTLVKDDPGNRRWYLLAAQKHRELSEMKKN
jgi:predicted Ser/Thr protein kinase